MRSAPVVPAAVRPRQRLLFLFLVGALAFAVHAASLWNGFVYDDHNQIANNPWMRAPEGVAAIFSHDFWGFAPQWPKSNMYRPLVHLLNRSIYQAFGPRPFPYHLASVLLHVGVTVLLALVLVRAVRDGGETEPWRGRFVPFAAAALFAAHPVHVEPVAWIAGSPDVLASAFLLGALLLQTQVAPDARGAGWARAGAGGLFFLALLSKEMALLFPLAVLAYDHLVRREPLGALLLSAHRRYGGLLAAAAVYLVLRWQALGGFAPVAYDVQVPGWVRAAGFVKALLWYVERAVFPRDYLFFRALPLPPTPADSALLGGAALLGAFLAAWALAARRSPLVAWGAALAALTLAPVFFGFAVMMSVADRYLYLPLAGFSVTLAWLLGARWPAAEAGRKAVSVVSVVLICGVYAAAANSWIRVFRSDLALWSHTVAEGPQNGMARAMLADALLSQGRHAEGLREAREAARLGFGDPLNLVSIGAALISLGRPGEAVEPLEESLRRDPENGPAHKLLGKAWLALGDLPAAAGHFRQALAAEPGDPEAHHGLGAALERQGEFRQALEEYEEALRLVPGAPEPAASAERVRRFLQATKQPPPAEPRAGGR
jgi:tetratricopeptide (TPR) repeat protein